MLKAHAALTDPYKERPRSRVTFLAEDDCRWCTGCTGINTVDKRINASHPLLVHQSAMRPKINSNATRHCLLHVLLAAQQAACFAEGADGT
jgi:hypothetical protein